MRDDIHNLQASQEWERKYCEVIMSRPFARHGKPK